MRLVWTLVMICVMLDLFASSANGRSEEPQVHYGSTLHRRAGRSILSRMATGFGKRGSLLHSDLNTAAIDDILTLMYKDPAIARAILRKYFGTNDGAVGESGQFS